MNQLSYNYSKHTVEELGNEVSIVDAKANPDRATALYRELFRRLMDARQDAEHAASEQALGSGARFDQLDTAARRRFFWPYFWFHMAFGVAYAIAIALVAVVIAAVIIAVQRGNGVEIRDPTQYIQLVLGLALVVPMAAWWLRQITKRTFGGYCLRIMRKSE
jgi:hypothetical protein